MTKIYLYKKSVQNAFVKAIKNKEGLFSSEDSTAQWEENKFK